MKIVVTPHAGSRPDRGGDPLDGLVNLFDLGVVLVGGVPAGRPVVAQPRPAAHQA